MGILNRQLSFILAATCVGSLAASATWAADQRTNARELGMIEGVLKYCGSVNPEAAAKLRDEVARMAQGSGDAALAQVRKTGEYRMGFDSIADFVSHGSESDAAKICSASPDALK